MSEPAGFLFEGLQLLCSGDEVELNERGGGDLGAVISCLNEWMLKVLFIILY